MIAIDNATTLARSAAATNGISLTPEALAAAAIRLAADLTHDGGQLGFDSAPPFRIEAGQPIDIGLAEHIIGVVRELAGPITETPEAPIATTIKPGAAISDFGKAFAAQEDAAIQREIAAWPNPWTAQHVNRTRQVVIANRNPVLAAKLKTEANL